MEAATDEQAAGLGGAGGGGGEDQLLFEEKDEQFWLSVGKSLSGRFLFADSGSTETSEIHSLDLDAGPDAQLKVRKVLEEATSNPVDCLARRHSHACGNMCRSSSRGDSVS